MYFDEESDDELLGLKSFDSFSDDQLDELLVRFEALKFSTPSITEEMPKEKGSLNAKSSSVVDDVLPDFVRLDQDEKPTAVDYITAPFKGLVGGTVAAIPTTVGKAISGVGREMEKDPINTAADMFLPDIIGQPVKQLSPAP